MKFLKGYVNGVFEFIDGLPTTKILLVI